MSQADDTKKPLTYPCPQCGQSAQLDAGNQWRPFCSERCKLLDLGEWFSERHAIPAADSADNPPAQDDDLLQ